MWRLKTKYGRSSGPILALALLFINYPLFSQKQSSVDSVKFSRPDKIINIPGSKYFLFSYTPFILQRTPIPTSVLTNDKTPVLLDSLKAKASKHLITRKLYDLIIVSNKPDSRKQISESSEIDYLKYSGRKIRKIEIQRLNVFGSNINTPGSFNPNKIESLLNKTHLNTNEFIIRKNLLFSEGDTVSPLVISDNERIIRQLPYIYDSRIIIVPISDEEADIIVLTKDVYSLGASFEYSSINKGSFALFEKNILGIGHEFRLEVPYNSDLPDSPGFGIEYNVDNISKSFINLNLYYFDGLGKKTYGFNLDRKLISSATKYAGGISIREMYTTEDLDTLPVPEPLKYNLQDYWLSRSFLIDKESVTRLIFGARYTNNNVFDHPFILPDSYHYLQKYRIFLGSAAISIQKFYKTNLIYSYGHTEDIPYGGLFNVTVGKEINEFKDRFYAGVNLSVGQSIRSIGYLYGSLGYSSFFYGHKTEQGLFSVRTNFFSNLSYLGKFRLRNFVKIDYTRGFDRNTEEHLIIYRENGFSGFKNDSLGGVQRLSLSLESVLFSPANYFGFRFAFFAFADIGSLFGTNENIGNNDIVSSVGLGIRIRNDNLVFNTLQIRLGYFPNLPLNSKVNYFLISGEQLLHPSNFDPGPPSVLPYR